MTFGSCGSLSEVTLPESIKSIGNGAFQNCYSLKSMVIPDSVKSLGEYAFNNCESIEITYKGTEYTYDTLDNLYKAING